MPRLTSTAVVVSLLVTILLAIAAVVVAASTQRNKGKAGVHGGDLEAKKGGRSSGRFETDLEGIYYDGTDGKYFLIRNVGRDGPCPMNVPTLVRVCADETCSDDSAKVDFPAEATTVTKGPYTQQCHLTIPSGNKLPLSNETKLSLREINDPFFTLCSDKGCTSPFPTPYPEGLPDIPNAITSKGFDSMTTKKYTFFLRGPAVPGKRYETEIKTSEALNPFYNYYTDVEATMTYDALRKKDLLAYNFILKDNDEQEEKKWNVHWGVSIRRNFQKDGKYNPDPLTWQQAITYKSGNVTTVQSNDPEHFRFLTPNFCPDAWRRLAVRKNPWRSSTTLSYVVAWASYDLSDSIHDKWSWISNAFPSALSINIDSKAYSLIKNEENSLLELCEIDATTHQNFVKFIINDEYVLTTTDGDRLTWCIANFIDETEHSRYNGFARASYAAACIENTGTNRGHLKPHIDGGGFYSWSFYQAATLPSSLDLILGSRRPCDDVNKPKQCKVNFIETHEATITSLNFSKASVSLDAVLMAKEHDFGNANQMNGSLPDKSWPHAYYCDGNFLAHLDGLNHAMVEDVDSNRINSCADLKPHKMFDCHEIFVQDRTDATDPYAFTQCTKEEKATNCSAMNKCHFPQSNLTSRNCSCYDTYSSDKNYNTNTDVLRKNCYKNLHYVGHYLSVSDNDDNIRQCEGLGVPSPGAQVSPSTPSPKCSEIGPGTKYPLHANTTCANYFAGSGDTYNQCKCSDTDCTTACEEGNTCKVMRGQCHSSVYLDTASNGVGTAVNVPGTGATPDHTGGMCTIANDSPQKRYDAYFLPNSASKDTQFPRTDTTLHIDDSEMWKPLTFRQVTCTEDPGLPPCHYFDSTDKTHPYKSGAVSSKTGCNLIFKTDKDVCERSYGNNKDHTGFVHCTTIDGKCTDSVSSLPGWYGSCLPSSEVGNKCYVNFGGA